MKENKKQNVEKKFRKRNRIMYIFSKIHEDIIIG